MDADLQSIILNNVLPVGYTFIFHPLIHCRILMQLGYEPDPPYLGHTIPSLLGFGPKLMKYPSFFTYSKRVAGKVGWYGLFTVGLPSRFLYTNISTLTIESVYNKISNKDCNAKVLDTDKSLKDYVTDLSILAVARVSGVLVSYPFEVIMIRQMAEIMGDDGASSFLWVLVGKIFREEGLRGFYGGVSAKIIGELITLGLAGSLLFLVNNYILSRDSRLRNDLKEYMPTLSNMVATQFTYKYTVMSTVMALSGSNTPYSIPLKNYLDAYNYLKSKRGLSRGSSLFLRYAY